MVSCDTMDSGCNGGSQANSWNFMYNTGTVFDACMPYTSGINGTVPACPTKCVAGNGTKYGTTGAYVNVGGSGETSIMNAISVGPLQTQFQVYEDFYAYDGGIYQHVYGAYEGGHAVEFVGYGTNNDGVKFWGKYRLI